MPPRDLADLLQRPLERDAALAIQHLKLPELHLRGTLHHDVLAAPRVVAQMIDENVKGCGAQGLAQGAGQRQYLR